MSSKIKLKKKVNFRPVVFTVFSLVLGGTVAGIYFLINNNNNLQQQSVSALAPLPPGLPPAPPNQAYRSKVTVMISFSTVPKINTIKTDLEREFPSATSISVSYSSSSRRRLQSNTVIVQMFFETLSLSNSAVEIFQNTNTTTISSTWFADSGYTVNSVSSPTVNDVNLVTPLPPPSPSPPVYPQNQPEGSPQTPSPPSPQTPSPPSPQTPSPPSPQTPPSPSPVPVYTYKESSIGSVRGWYGTSTSVYLLNKPRNEDYSGMIHSSPHGNETWIINFLPNENQLPNVEIQGWNWTEELSNIVNLTEYLGNTLGKFRSLMVGASEVADPLIWRVLNSPGRTEITNTLLKDKIDSGQTNFTASDWESFNVSEHIGITTYVNVSGKYYGPSIPITNNINENVYNFITSNICPYKEPNLKAEECGGVCYTYFTCNNIQYVYFVVSIGWWYGENEHFGNKTRARRNMYSSIAHECCHVVQRHLISPSLPIRWHGEDYGFGEKSPNAISRWWIEGACTIIPQIMGDLVHEYSLETDIIESLTDIRNGTINGGAEEFANRQVYTDETYYGYLTRFHWGMLSLAYMAKLTSWKYVLVDWNYDFQRVDSDTNSTKNGETFLVPDLDKLFYHNFGKSEIDFLKDLYELVSSNSSIDKSYFLPEFPYVEGIDTFRL
jgi:hypothetical protein